MNNRPVLLRTVIACVVILVFALSMFPLTQRDFYATFSKMVKADAKDTAASVVADAEKIQSANSDLYPSQALLKAADNRGVELKKLVPENKNIEDNRDVVGAVRKAASSSIRLGLDLAGGVEFMVELVPDEEFLKKLDNIKDQSQAREEAEARMENEFSRYRDMAIEILRKRLESQKIYEAEITPAGARYVSLKAPIVSKDEKVNLLNLIQMSAKLRFRLVHENSNQLVAEYLRNPKTFTVPVGYELMSNTTFRPGKEPLVNYYIVDSRWLMDGKGIVDATPAKDQFGQRQIDLRFDQDGAAKFGKITKENTGRQLAIVLDGVLYCAPTIKDHIPSGRAQISGSFSNEELTNIANALVSGGFPFQIKVEGVFDTDPKLGSDNVKNGIYAGVFALLAVVVFMVFYYMVAGLIAVTALTINVVLVLGALAAFDATLTLPGIAGIILTIGMAVDANVLIFERIREELSAGKSLHNAINLGYEKAFSAVVDANITTLFIAFILMNVGTGPVKGFAVTLGIGIVTSLFTALFLTRLIFDYITRLFDIKTLKMRQFLQNPTFDFLKRTRKAFALSGILIILSFAAFIIKGEGMLGVDFTGGTLVSFNYQERVPGNEVEKVLKDANIPGTVSYKTNAGAADNKNIEIIIRKDLSSMNKAGNSPKDAIAALLNSNFPKAGFSGGQESSVGGLIGWEFSKSAILAVLLSFLGIIVYVSFRYEFSYAMAGIIALIHDVIIASGVFVVMGREFSLPVIAALLTIIGYSINDTIVIFDRIRENVGIHPDAPYKTTVNISINDTLNRTLLTSLTTFLVVVILFFFGGIAINDFVLVMMLGIVIGTYSSIFIACPIISVWHKKIGKQQDKQPVRQEQK